MVDFEITNYACANGRDRLLQPDYFPSEGWMGDRRPLGLMYRELWDGTIQLQSLGLRSERIRPNGEHASRTHTDAIPLTAPNGQKRNRRRLAAQGG